jgi:hypothetical protein
MQGGHAPPAWPTPARRRWWKHLEIKIVIAVLIGLVSVTGAVLTWQASQLDENATDQDRLAVTQTVQQRQAEAAVDATLRDELTSFDQFRQLTFDAAGLRDQAAGFRKQAASGDASQMEALAVNADTQATQLEAQAQLLSDTAAFRIGLVKNDADGKPKSYDVEARRQSLFISLRQTPDLDPAVTAQKGVELRQRGQRLSGWAIPLVGAVVLLTFAQLSRQHRARNVLFGLAMAVYFASTIIAFVGE